MRWIAAVLCALAVEAAPAAWCAPTCWSAAGETVRCGSPRALPVGARLSAAQEAERRGRPAGADSRVLLGLAALLGGLVALFALLPDFQRWER